MLDDIRFNLRENQQINWGQGLLWGGHRTCNAEISRDRTLGDSTIIKYL